MTNPVVVPHTITPADGIVNPLKTLDDWRALFHQLVPVIVTALVSLHLATNNQVALWVPLVFAIADPILSIGNTTDKVRKAIYSLLAVLQGGTIIVTVFEMVAQHANPEVAPIITAAGAIVSGILAKFFTPTPTSIVAVPVVPVEEVA